MPIPYSSHGSQIRAEVLAVVIIHMHPRYSTTLSVEADLTQVTILHHKVQRMREMSYSNLLLGQVMIVADKMAVLVIALLPMSTSTPVAVAVMSFTQRQLKSNAQWQRH